MTPNEILQHSYQCLAQSSPEKLPPAADGNKYRDPRSDIMQRMRHLKGISPSNPSPQGSGNPMEKEADGTGETKGIEDTGRARPSTTTVQSSCELTRLGQHAQGCAGLHQMLCLYCSFQIGVFIKSLSVKTSWSLFIVPSLGLLGCFPSAGFVQF